MERAGGENLARSLLWLSAGWLITIRRNGLIHTGYRHVYFSSGICRRSHLPGARLSLSTRWMEPWLADDGTVLELGQDVLGIASTIHVGGKLGKKKIGCEQ